MRRSEAVVGGGSLRAVCDMKPTVRAVFDDSASHVSECVWAGPNRCAYGTKTL